MQGFVRVVSLHGATIYKKMNVDRVLKEERELRVSVPLW
jgi:hypothetical protein